MTDRKRPSPDGRCVAKSKKTGERCKRQAMAGGRVCPVHGGSAPQVKRAAAERLAEARDDALGLLSLQIQKTIEGIEQNRPQLVGYVEPTVAVRAVKELSELVETMKGRPGTRTAHEVSGPDGQPLTPAVVTITLPDNGRGDREVADEDGGD